MLFGKNTGSCDKKKESNPPEYKNKNGLTLLRVIYEEPEEPLRDEEARTILKGRILVENMLYF